MPLPDRYARRIPAQEKTLSIPLNAKDFRIQSASRETFLIRLGAAVLFTCMFNRLVR